MFCDVLIFHRGLSHRQGEGRMNYEFKPMTDAEWAKQLAAARIGQAQRIMNRYCECGNVLTIDYETGESYCGKCG